MNQRIFAFGAAILLLGMVPAVLGHGDEKHPIYVTVDDYEFDPAYLEITTGTLVNWTNVGEVPHEVATHIHSPASPGPLPHAIVTAVRTDDPAAQATSWHDMVFPEDDPTTPTWENTTEFEFTEPGVYVINCNLGGDHETMRQVIWVYDESH